MCSKKEVMRLWSYRNRKSDLFIAFIQKISKSLCKFNSRLFQPIVGLEISPVMIWIVVDCLERFIRFTHSLPLSPFPSPHCPHSPITISHPSLSKRRLYRWTRSIFATSRIKTFTIFPWRYARSSPPSATISIRLGTPPTVASPVYAMAPEGEEYREPRKRFYC